MHRVRVLAGSVAVAVAAMFVGGPVAQAQSAAKETPTATEVGVTPTEIHVAVVADVDNTLAPGLFKGFVDGAQAGAKYLNSKHGGGGLAGRKVVIDFIDSHLAATDARNAVIQACANDVAMVGTAALFLPTIDDAVNCVDKAGKTTGLPDYAGIAQTVEGCAPTSFPINPPSVVCDTLSQSPSTYQSNNGAFTYLQSKHKHGLHGAMLYGADTKDSQILGQVLIDAAVTAGIEADQDLGISARALQSAYTPIVQRMKDDGSNFAYTTSTASSAISLMTEAKLQGLDPASTVFTCTTACYDKSITASADTNTLYVPLNFLPFEEAKSNKTLASFLKYMGGVDKASGFAVYGWVGMLLFADAVNKVVADDGVNGLTRANLLAATKTITAFDAGGMFGTVNIGDKVSTACTLLTQVENGKFVRIWPSKAGTFDCKPSNHVLMKGNAIVDKG